MTTKQTQHKKKLSKRPHLLGPPIQTKIMTTKKTSSQIHISIFFTSSPSIISAANAFAASVAALSSSAARAAASLGGATSSSGYTSDMLSQRTPARLHMDI